jgi:phosphate transport system protein
MSVHLQREIGILNKRLLSLCALVEDQVDRAIQAVVGRDADMAAAVEARDAEADRREVELEEECLKILALHQPVAIDLRFVVVAMKINNDLERIGDLAVNIARKAAALAEQGPTEIPFDISGMWQKTQGMLRDSVDALVNLDAGLADKVCARDGEVDQMKRDNRKRAESILREDAGRVPGIMSLLAVSRNLERIADHATNIAEDVIYMVQGRIIRHGTGIDGG